MALTFLLYFLEQRKTLETKLVLAKASCAQPDTDHGRHPRILITHKKTYVFLRTNERAS